MRGPEVLVILPAFNSELFISDAIDSILGQTFEDLELIVINDGSMDNTEQQKELFNKASSEKLSVRELREEVKKSHEMLDTYPRIYSVVVDP